LIDDMSGMIWVCPLKHKANFVDWFFKMDAIFLNQYKRHVSTLWTDNGGEYVNQWLQDYCSQHGILLELTVPHTPQQNGVAEQANWTLTEHMHAMMKDTDCPMMLLGEAICTAAYCLNQTPTSTNGGITPFQAFKGSIPDISHMKVFYSDVYIHHPKSDGAKKLGDHAHLVKFIGYPDGVNGYKFYDPATCTISLSCSTHVLETPNIHPTSTTPTSRDTSTESPSIMNRFPLNKLH